MTTSANRVDEIEKYYQSALNADKAVFYLFWIIAVISLLIPYVCKLHPNVEEVIKTFYILLVLVHFATSLILGMYLIPLAEKKRRKQLISNALGTPLVQEKTELYYNNDFPPSILRLGANIMENCLFSREVATQMLIPIRWIVGIYTLAWVMLFTLRQSNLDILLWVTQLVFSSAIIMRWLQLELLRHRHDLNFESLYNHYLNGQQGNAKSTAIILDAFANYESTKSSAGIMLSSKVFHKINSELTLKWQQLRGELKMKE